jgi:hypothetical protein
MLAISDKNGIVEASLPGLADISRVDLSQCIEALEKLKQPDKFSRSQEYEGRRIREVDGGWLLLNYTKYRGMLISEKIREQTRIRVAKHRERRRNSNVTVTRNIDLTQDNAHTDPDPDPTADPDPKGSIKEKSIKKKNAYPDDFLQFWDAYPKKIGKKIALIAWQKAKRDGLPNIDIVIQSLQKQKMSQQWINDRGKWIPNPKKWIDEGRWDDEIDLRTPTMASEPPRNETAIEGMVRRNREVLNSTDWDDDEPLIIDIGESDE